MKDVFEEFRKNLRNLIYSNNMSLRDAADAIGTAAPTLSRYLTGARDPEARNIIAISSYFGVSVDWLLGITEGRMQTLPSDLRKLCDLFSLASKEDKKIVELILSKYEK